MSHRKATRELKRIALEEGLERPLVEPGDPHARLYGYVTVDGRRTEIEMVVSLNECLRSPLSALRKNIRRAIALNRSGIVQ